MPEGFGITVANCARNAAVNCRPGVMVTGLVNGVDCEAPSLPAHSRGLKVLQSLVDLLLPFDLS